MLQDKMYFIITSLKLAYEILKNPTKFSPATAFIQQSPQLTNLLTISTAYYQDDFCFCS